MRKYKQIYLWGSEAKIHAWRQFTGCCVPGQNTWAVVKKFLPMELDLLFFFHSRTRLACPLSSRPKMMCNFIQLACLLTVSSNSSTHGLPVFLDCHKTSPIVNFRGLALFADNTKLHFRKYVWKKNLRSSERGLSYCSNCGTRRGRHSRRICLPARLCDCDCEHSKDKLN